ncbi:hypothetical protein NDJ85_18885 [Vibrio parahaemolyticus]|nr:MULTISPECIES: hypothetical protein [Vibrio]MCS0218810.1 hypothetical protein [Vibrio alginolyticus]MCR9929861.1 hypothetical protein [Vibrio parahaemolyticus]MCS0079846.1 hypothetical protein [Vibrio parahaemolyticus]MCZ5860831.1 hypothetical protein [Vibrio parahaemolyticus]MCZ6279603.1 hypothetical protein [Vibrio parahaemolyticus]
MIKAVCGSIGIASLTP